MAHCNTSVLPSKICHYATHYNKTSQGIAVDSEGSVYIADVRNHCIRKIDAERGVSTLCGTGMNRAKALCHACLAC